VIDEAAEQEAALLMEAGQLIILSSTYEYTKLIFRVFMPANFESVLLYCTFASDRRTQSVPPPMYILFWEGLSCHTCIAIEYYAPRRKRKHI
jgi:hypothetical protein